jgi:hypothetical protein
VLIEATASCPTGKTITGGGGEITSSAAEHNSRLAMFRSFPVSPTGTPPLSTQWRATAVILGGFSSATVTLRSYAICATAS